jgi:hypothetical protein
MHKICRNADEDNNSDHRNINCGVEGKEGSGGIARIHQSRGRKGKGEEEILFIRTLARASPMAARGAVEAATMTRKSTARGYESC